MFDENIDVAAIMREIKADVTGDDFGENIRYSLYNSDTNRITDFIVNVMNDSEKYLDIGNHLPLCERYPSFIGVIFRVISRIIRKSARFILRDQIAVNHNTISCLNALIEREDSIYTILENKIKPLEQLLHNQYGNFSDACNINCQNVNYEPGEFIHERWKYYMTNYIDDADEQVHTAIDIGCGRGEWIRYMKEKGYKAIGVDRNKNAADECTQLGMNVFCGDGTEYLKTINDESVSVISAFRVIEYLDKVQVMELIRQAKRALKPGGLLLIETPDIQHIEKMFPDMRADMPYKNLLHPQLLLFMAELSQFTKFEIIYWKDHRIEKQIIHSDGQEEHLSETSFSTVSIKDNIVTLPYYALAVRK